MSKKLRIAVPLCGLRAVAVVALFCVSGWAAGEENMQPKTVVVETMNAQGMEAPGKTLETLAPVQTVTQGEENPEEDDSSSNDETIKGDGESPYELSDEERIAVERAVMCEAGGEGSRGQMMVAQCILDGSLRNGYNIIQTIEKYQIASTSYSNVTDEVRESVSRVFDDGERITEQKADLWYNPALVQSSWHEEQQYVITIGQHRFFWMNNSMN